MQTNQRFLLNKEMRSPFFRKPNRTCKKLYLKKIEIENISKCKHGLNTDYVCCDNDIDGTSNYGSEIYHENDDNDSTSDYGSMEFDNDEGNDGDYDYDCDGSSVLENHSTPKQSTEKEKLVEIKGALNEFKIYLADSTAGLNKSATETNTIIGRIAKFLIWSYILTHFTPIEIFNTIPFVFEVIFEKFSLVGQYVDYLGCSKAMKPSTLLQFLANVKNLIVWYTIFRQGCDVEYVVPSLQKDRAYIILKQAASNLDKLNKRHISTVHTYANDIRDKKLPKEGIEIIRAAVIARLLWAESQQTPMDKATYEMFMGLMIVSFFVFSVQGRISGIADMKVAL